MATERQAPDAELSCSGLATCDVTEHDADPDSDSTCIVASGNNTNTEYGVDFPTPSGNPTVGADLQEFRAGVEEFDSGQTGTPDARIELWENGGLVRAGSDTPVSSYAVLSFTWNANELGTADGSLVQCKVIGTKSGGGPGARNTVNIGQIEWNVDYVGASIDYQNTGQGAIAPAGSETRKISSANFGQYALAITGTLAAVRTAFLSAGGYAIAIAGTLIKNTKRPAGEYAIPITGNAAKKMQETAGEYAMPTTGTLVAKKSFFQAVGEYAIAITGSVTSKVKYIIAAGGYALPATGTLIKKITADIGGYALTITGALIRKIKLLKGAGAATPTGTLTKIYQTTETSGGSGIDPTGSLATNYIPGGGPGPGGLRKRIIGLLRIGIFR